MNDSMIPKVDYIGTITDAKIDTVGPNPFRLSVVKTGDESTKNFSEVMMDLVKSLDDEAKKPDKLMTEAMVNPEIDIHDVMIAVNQAEITMTVATQVTTKILQGYEKIISMQV